MVKDDGKAWLVELTQNITGQLKQNREDIASLWSHIQAGKDHHTACREQILLELLKIDKRVEVILVRIGIYVAIGTFAVTAVMQFVFKQL
jgi:hypothetical protein